MDKSGIDEAVCSRKVASGKRVAGPFRSLINDGVCILSMLVLHESTLVPDLAYGRETMIWREERSMIRAVQMDNLRGLLNIRRMDKVLNALIRLLYRVKKGVERMENDRIAVRVYVGVCAGRCSVGRPWKRWIDNERLLKEDVLTSSKQGE